MESMVEQNGQWYTLGNRTLNNLNLANNLLSDVCVQSFLDAVAEQDTYSESVTDGSIGLFRISLQVAVPSNCLMFKSTLTVTPEQDY
jgi:hypothetical protein